MGEDIKSDLAGIAITHPFFADMATNALNYIEELEKENKNYKEYAVMMTTEGLLINGVKFSFNDYIPKSKVIEKIEEYKKHLPDKTTYEEYKNGGMYSVIGKQTTYGVAIEVLQNLLREE